MPKETKGKRPAEEQSGKDEIDNEDDGELSMADFEDAFEDEFDSEDEVKDDDSNAGEGEAAEDQSEPQAQTQKRVCDCTEQPLFYHSVAIH